MPYIYKDKRTEEPIGPYSVYLGLGPEQFTGPDGYGKSFVWEVEPTLVTDADYYELHKSNPLAFPLTVQETI